MTAKQQQKKTYNSGDIFTFEIAPGEYGFGRVILDIYKQCFEPGLIDKNSFLYFGKKDTIYIELFRNTSAENNLDYKNAEVLVAGLFTSNIDIHLGYWEIIGNEPVDPKSIDFPQYLSQQGAFTGNYIWGELNHSIEILYERVAELRLYRKEFASIEIPQIALFSLGRQDEILLKPELRHMRDISKSDLRYSSAREEIHNLLPDEQKGSYYEISRSHGFDLKRFFE